MNGKTRFCYEAVVISICIEEGGRNITPKALRRNVFERILGICATTLPVDSECWTFSDGKIEIDLSLAPDISKIGRVIRLEKKNLSERVLVIRGDDDTYFAFRNKCTHMGRRSRLGSRNSNNTVLQFQKYNV